MSSAPSIRIVLALATGVLALALALAPSAFAAPGTGWVTLDDGEVGTFDWAVKVKRPPGGEAGAQAAQRPCLMVGTTWQRNRFNIQRTRYRRCIGASAKLTRSEPLLVANGVAPTLGAPAEVTAVGMVFARPAEKVRATFADGETITIPLQSMTPGQARTAGLGRFSYAGFAVHGNWCTERLVSRDRSGRILWDSGEDEYTCSSGSPAELLTVGP